MTHARKKGSLSQCRGEGRGHVEGGSHGETVGGAWPARSMAKKVKARNREQHESQKHYLKMDKAKKHVSSRGKAKAVSERKRKLYPLRGRAAASDGEALSCHVLLTRLGGQEELIPEVDPKKEKSLQDKLSAPEPRKRRLASLNAEAVNSLLLEKKDTKLAKKHGDGASTTKTCSKRTSKAEMCQMKRKKDESDASLYAPAPRRLAGLNAAALMKLTSSTTGRIKSDRCKPKAQTPSKKLSRDPDGACEVCKSRSYESELSHAAAKPGFQSQSILGYPVTVVKEEPVEAELSAFCCCPPDCHRLALFLAQETDESRIKHLVPAHPALTLSAHPCVCADPCYAGYLVHIAHPGPGLSAPALLASSGIAHPFCGSVGSGCYRCGVGRYAFASRTCSFPTSCSHCRHPIKTEAFSLSQDEHSRSLLIPPTLPLSGCPSMPRVNRSPPLSRCPSMPRVNRSPPLSGCPSMPRVNQSPPLSRCPSMPRVNRSPSLSGCPSMPRVNRSPSLSGCPSMPRVNRSPPLSGCPSMPRVNRSPSLSGCPSMPRVNRSPPLSGCPSMPRVDRSPPLSGCPSMPRLNRSPPLSGCPSMPRVNRSPPLDPRLLSSMSDRRQAEVRLKVGKKCPQNPKPSNGSLTMGHTRLSKQPAASPASAKHQRKVSRHEATNGWRPVGVSTEKEVFIAGDDKTVLRQCYEAVERDGEVIRVRDTVLLRSGPRKKALPYVAKISALWEDPRTGELMMSLFWYYRPEHTQGGRDPSMHCENEIFASRHQDENSVACIEERCYVLPLAQYCRFCALAQRCAEGVCESSPLVPAPSASATPSHRPVPAGVDPQLVYLCRHVYDLRYGRILKNLQ
ncbi:hypothetical protein R3I94_015846 [Phoxinus phoxinus]|uniref:BAH domain-containing protein n=1 Tax=Phoxinus phoxinus TaxID=58324 RepID=A0AAN9H538_9TELE